MIHFRTVLEIFNPSCRLRALHCTREIDLECKSCRNLLSAGWRERTRESKHVTKYGIILDTSSRGCAACLVIQKALCALVVSNLPPEKTIVIKAVLNGRDEHLQIRVGDETDSESTTDRIDLYSSPNSSTPWGLIHPKLFRNVEPDSSTPGCAQLVRSWLETCRQSHQSCRSEGGESPLLPTRVIHVGTDEVRPRLILSRGRAAPYTALSYSWGGISPLCTKTATLEQMMSGIALSDLPKTFLDAVILSRAIGVDYLWIDSLCIVQDNEHDWETESARMAAVYSNALLVISADTGRDSTAGFLGPRTDHNRSVAITCPSALAIFHDHRDETSRVYARRAQLGPDEANLKHKAPSERLVLSIVGHTRDGGIALLDTRGWTFQERLLSPRTLHYTEAEMVFECRASLCCECSTETSYGGTNFKEQGYMWTEIVEQFTRRSLTRDTDRLPGIAGAAAALGYGTADDYIFGIWKSDIPRALLWVTRGAPGGRQAHRHPAFYAPSWSWASVVGHINFGHATIGLTQKGAPDPSARWAEPVGFDIEKTTANPYGPGRGSAIFRGLLGAAVVERFQAKDSIRLESSADGAPSPKMACFMDVEEPYEVAQGEVVSLLMLYSKESTESPGQWEACGLVLKRVDGADDDATRYYTRVGLAYDMIHSGWTEGFSCTEVHVI